MNFFNFIFSILQVQGWALACESLTSVLRIVRLENVDVLVPRSLSYGAGRSERCLSSSPVWLQWSCFLSILVWELVEYCA